VEYIYQIQYLDSYPTYSNLDNVVCNVVYQLHGYSGSIMNTINAEQEITIDSSNQNFIPFEQLTNDIIVSWVEATAGTEKITAMKTEIENNIKALMKPESIRVSPPFSI
jgi:hypothetical protein